MALIIFILNIISCSNFFNGILLRNQEVVPTEVSMANNYWDISQYKNYFKLEISQVLFDFQGMHLTLPYALSLKKPIPEGGDHLKRNRKKGIISLGLTVFSIGLLIISPTFVMSMVCLGLFLSGFTLSVITVSEDKRRKLNQKGGYRYAIGPLVLGIVAIILGILIGLFSSAN